MMCFTLATKKRNTGSSARLVVIVNLDEIIELTCGTVQMKCEVQVLTRFRFLLSFRERTLYQSLLVFENTQNGPIVALGAEKEEVIGATCSPCELALRNIFGTVIRSTTVEGHFPTSTCPFYSEATFTRSSR
jgi:hypothetical protein